MKDIDIETFVYNLTGGKCLPLEEKWINFIELSTSLINKKNLSAKKLNRWCYYALRRSLMEEFPSRFLSPHERTIMCDFTHLYETSFFDCKILSDKLTSPTDSSLWDYHLQLHKEIEDIDSAFKLNRYGDKIPLKDIGMLPIKIYPKIIAAVLKRIEWAVHISKKD